MQITPVQIKSALTRTTGFLETVCSHSLQPYRGCSFGRALCGVGCYVQHNIWLTGGRRWGSFLEACTNAAATYRAGYSRERAWARHRRGRFAIFMSSSTDPFVPQEDRFGVTRGLLESMVEQPPDELILQTHTHRVLIYEELYPELSRRCRLRLHLSIESDRDRLPGLPPPASSVAARLDAAARLKELGLRVIVTVAPLLPMADPEAFFTRLSEVADGAVIDHFIGGDGSTSGSRTMKTALPAAMEKVIGRSSRLDYRDEIVQTARRLMPGRVGVNIDGFAGRFLD